MSPPLHHKKFNRPLWHLLDHLRYLNKKLYVTLHAKRGLIQISRYGYFHGPGREIVKNYWNVSEISLSRREKFTATVKYFTP